MPGDDSDKFFGFSTSWPRPKIDPGDRVYILCEGFIRGYAPLVEMRTSSHRGGWCKIEFIRAGGAVAVTIRGPDGLPLPVVGFRGWRYRFWELENEMPFPGWQTYGTKSWKRKSALPLFPA